MGDLKVKMVLSSEHMQKEEEKKDDEMVPAGNLAAAQQ